ncbi:restriction modification system DNA specificity subunit, partial [Candidatus Haloredivivus sp. G17]
MTETEYKEVRLGPDKLQIPSDWNLEKIEPMISVLTGESFSSEQFNEEGKGLPLVRIRNLQGGDTDTYFSGEYKEKYIIEPE